MISVLLPLKTVAGLNAREHWRARSKRVNTERLTTRLVLAPHPKPDLPCIVLMVRLSPGTLDDDNLQGAAKAVRDGVADWLGVPDNDPRIGWHYAQERVPRGTFGVRVEVTPTTDLLNSLWGLVAAVGIDGPLPARIPVESLGRDQ